MPARPIRLFVCVLSVASTLGLAACGDGWEMVPYHGTPYDGRTAGSGVAYVRAHLTPAKGPILKVETPLEKAPPKQEVAPAPAKPAQSADAVFRAKQKK